MKLIERLRSDSERQLQFRPVDIEPDEDQYDGIGAFLRQTRESHGLDLFSVASALRIQVAHIDAIESGDFKRLPGATYAVGFLRTYANYLGLDAGDVVQRFKEETEIAPTQTKLVFPEPVEETRRPGLRTALVTVLIAAGLYGGWVYLERHGQAPIEVVSEPPQRFANLIEDEKAVPRQDGPAGAAAATENRAAISEPAADVEPAESGVGPSIPHAAVPMLGGPVAPGSEPMTPAEEAATSTAAVTPPATETVAGVSVERAASPQPPTTMPQEPTRVQVTPVESDEAIARADAVAEQGSAEGEASPVEQAAAAEVASIVNDNTAAPQADRDVAPQPSQTEPTVIIPPVKPAELKRAAVEDPDGLTAAANETNASEGPASTVAEAPPTAHEEEDTAPQIPQIQARLEPPQPPSIPAAPPPAPRLDSAGAASGAGGVATGDPAGPRYRPQIYGASTGTARVVVRAKADSWVQVQGANNELLLTRILRAGDTYYAPDRRDLMLMTGNAGAIEVQVDGEVIGTLGPVGAVRRNIDLHADSLRSFVRERGNTNR